jgi:hypothetical protein
LRLIFFRQYQRIQKPNFVDAIADIFIGILEFGSEINNLLSTALQFILLVYEAVFEGTNGLVRVIDVLGLCHYELGESGEIFVVVVQFDRFVSAGSSQLVHHAHQQAKLMIDKLTATSRDKTIELDNNHKDLARLSQLIMAETKHIDDSNQSIRALKDSFIDQQNKLQRSTKQVIYLTAKLQDANKNVSNSINKIRFLNSLILTEENKSQNFLYDIDNLSSQINDVRMHKQKVQREEVNIHGLQAQIAKVKEELAKSDEEKKRL